MNEKENLKVFGNEQLKKDYIDRTLTSVEIEPTQEEQVIKAPEGYNGFNEVKVKGARLQQKIVTPSKEIQVIKADDGYYGLSDVIVSATPFNNDDVVEEINNVKVMLTDGANATPNDIKLGKTAYVGGKLITGNFEIGGTIEITDTEIKDVTNYQYAQVVDDNLKAENIASGKTILGIEGTFSDNSTGIIDGTITEIYNAEVTKIRNSALQNFSSLTSVSFPNATSIGVGAFQNCYSLKSVNIPLATSIGDRAFFRNSSQLTNIIFHNAKSIGNEAFYDCRNLKSAKFPKVETIYGYAFSYTNLTNIYLGYEGVVTISNTSVFGNPNVTAHVKPNFDLTALYAEATNWSSLIASGKVTIVEDYVE